MLIRLGKTRESTMLRAEEYKTAIRDYMESQGYAQTTDSSIEGHLPDMVFVPLAGKSWPKTIWVESKAQKLSLADRAFVEEVVGYLRRWLTLPRESRFKLMVFARDLQGVSKWNQVWGEGISKSNTMEWMKGSKLGREVASNYSSDLIVAFFSESDVVQADIPALTAGTKARESVGLAAMETRRRAVEENESMQKRSRPLSRRSVLMGNLLRFGPPLNYAILDVDALSRDDLWNLLRETRVPYSYPEKGVVLTIDFPNVAEHFESAHPKKMESAQIEDAQSRFPWAFSVLMNDALGKKVLQRRIRPWKGWYYFLADLETEEGVPRIIETPSRKTMQVAKPLFDQESGKLNFVFHQGFRMKYRKLWGDHFVSLGLRRVYTSEGITVVEGDSTSRIDRYFRRSDWNRSETQQAKVSKLAEYLFSLETLESQPDWSTHFRFQSLITTSTNWTPEPIEPDPEQAFISDYEEADTIDD
jgi:hypothetical protein